MAFCYVFFCNDVQDQRANRGRGLQTERYHPEQGDNATQMQVVTGSEIEGKDQPNPKHETRDKPLLVFKRQEMCVRTGR